MNTNIFWHICELNNFRDIVIDQYESLYESGLLDNIERVYVCYTGANKENINFLLNKHNKIQLINYTNKYKEYERPCLHKLLEWSQTNESNILYIHTKGVSHPHNHNVWLWRKMLEHYLIRNYKQCINYLNNYDIVGINLTDIGTADKLVNENHKMHFSGNFWWSKTSYIRTLPKIREDYTDLSIEHRYWLCERWILYYYPNNKYYEIKKTEHPHYYGSPPENYEHC